MNKESVFLMATKGITLPEQPPTTETQEQLPEQPPTIETVETKERQQNIETQGIERISPASRTHLHIVDNFTFWFSANMVISTLAIGVIATSIFQLGFWDSVLAIIIFNVLGALSVAFFSTLGPRLGLRQMIITRFSFGWVGASIIALFNVVACIGWATVNAIVGGQLITALSGGTINRPLSILVVAILTTIIGMYGYRYIHNFARYAWIPVTIIFFILTIIAAPKVTIIPTPTLNIAEIASFISFGGAVYGFAAGWNAYGADYNVYQPQETPARRIFWYTFLGVVLPCIALEIFGMALTTIYKGLSGADLLAAEVLPFGNIGTVLLVILALSVVTNNIPNVYSLGLSMQVLGKPLQRIRRSIWTLFGSVLYMLIAIPAVVNFNGTLSDFLLIVAYWLGPWTIILIEEHFFFRHGTYNVDDWNKPSKLPIGSAALIAFLIGLLGAYLGADQAVFVGPVARLFNPPYGMDVGFELSLVFGGISYYVLRRIELARFGR